MANRITRELRALKEAEPGTRFQASHERTKVDNRVLRFFLVVLGVALMLTAAVTFFIPGPNFVLVLAGLALVGGQSELVARTMDRAEGRVRRWHDEAWEPYPHKGRVKVIGAVIFAALVTLVAWVAWRQGWLPGWLPGVD